MTPETVLIKTSHDAQEMLRRLDSCLGYIDSRASLTHDERCILGEMRGHLVKTRYEINAIVVRETTMHRTEAAKHRE